MFRQSYSAPLWSGVVKSQGCVDEYETTDPGASILVYHQCSSFRSTTLGQNQEINEERGDLKNCGNYTIYTG